MSEHQLEEWEKASDHYPTKDCAFVHRSMETVLERLREVENKGSNASMSEIRLLRSELESYIDRSSSNIADAKQIAITAQQNFAREMAKNFEVKVGMEKRNEYILTQQRELLAASHKSTSEAVDAKSAVAYFLAETWVAFKDEVKRILGTSRLTFSEKTQMAGITITVATAIMAGFGWYVANETQKTRVELRAMVSEIALEMRLKTDNIQRTMETYFERRR